jgi:ABC-type antimicrobial peptide transport system permease subunit
MGMVVRYSGDPAALAASARNILKKMDPDQALYQINSLEELLSRSLGRRRANLILIGASSVLALVLAFIGIYGVVSYHVSRRTHEIGVRMALGAQSHNIIRLIIKQTMTSALAGLLLGIAGAFMLNRYISNMLYKVTVTDPTISIAISILILFSAFIASFLPSRRATRIELSAALRSE